jgi:DNA (cytosine-5)-methyltransferase 1
MRRDARSIIRALDLFCGVGGSSHGARRAGVRIVAAVDVWDLARTSYRDNFKGVKLYSDRCERLSASRIEQDVGSIQLLIASPECTSHTCAKGGAPKSERSRETALQVVRFARVLKPRWIVVENVLHMRTWRRYRPWLQRLEALGYKHREQVLNAADFGVPQARRRLFVLFDREQTPPEITPPKPRRRVSARQIIESNGAYPYTMLNAKNRASATLERARRAITALGARRPFLVVYYGSDGGGGWQGVDTPLRTITTLDRFAYVRPRKRGYEMRMLQVPELQRAMGFPQSFKLRHGVRRDRIKLLGNAVCPPVMARVVRLLTRG